MKKTITTIAIALCSTCAIAQTKPDTTTIRTPRAQLTTLARNLQITQANLHKLDMSALLRDRLDSLYTQSINTLQHMWQDSVAIKLKKK